MILFPGIGIPVIEINCFMYVYRHSYAGKIVSLYWIATWRLAHGEHYQNQCWDIVSWTLRNKLQSNFNRNSYIFIQENVFENVGHFVSVKMCQGNGYERDTSAVFVYYHNVPRSWEPSSIGKPREHHIRKRYLPVKAQCWSRIFTAPEMAIAAAADF